MIPFPFQQAQLGRRFNGLNGDAYADAVLAAKPTHYWRMGDSTGTVAKNLGSGISGIENGTYVSSPTLGTTGLLNGSNDTAITTTGTEYMQTPIVAFGTAISFTWMGLFKATDVTNPRTMISSGVNSTGANPGCQMRFFNGKIDILRCGAALLFTSNGSYSTGTIYHVALSVDLVAALAYLYINGTLDKSNAVSGSTFANSGKNTLVGANDSAASGINERFTGVIDDVAFYTRALSSGEISAIAALR